MSRRRCYSSDSTAIMERFFDAVEMCVRCGLVKNVARFCSDGGISSDHYYHQRKDIGRGYFEVGWLLPLLSLGVSSEWLLTGRGLMFDPAKVSISPKPQAT